MYGNQSLGEQFALKALDLIGPDLNGLAVFFFLLDYILIGYFSPGLIAVVADRIHIVLHSLRPVFHQHFIDIILVQKRHLGKIGQQQFRNSGNQLLWLDSLIQLHQIGGHSLFPPGISVVHLIRMVNKFRVSGDRGDDLALLYHWMQISLAQRLKKDLPQRRVLSPIFGHAVHIGFRNAAVQMGVDVL